MRPTLLSAGIAFVVALSALPYPKTGGQCASGYRESGAYCTPMTDRAVPAIPKPRNGQCPSGWAQSGASCQMMKRSR